MPKVKVFYQF